MYKKTWVPITPQNDDGWTGGEKKEQKNVQIFTQETFAAGIERRVSKCSQSNTGRCGFHRLVSELYTSRTWLENFFVPTKSPRLLHTFVFGVNLLPRKRFDGKYERTSEWSWQTVLFMTKKKNYVFPQKFKQISTHLSNVCYELKLKIITINLVNVWKIFLIQNLTAILQDLLSALYDSVVIE